MTAQAYQGKRVLITGGSGFIGTHLCAALDRLGAKIYVIDIRGKNSGNTSVFLPCDVRDAAQVAGILQDVSPEVVFHLAATIERDSSARFLDVMIDTNLRGTLNLLSPLTRLPSLQTVVVAGTCEEYGAISVPFSERALDHPVSPYSFSKACVTRLSMLMHCLYGLPVVVLRSTLAYGPGQSETMFLPSLISALSRNETFPMTAGEQTRDFVYIDDLVDCFLLAGIAAGCRGEIINVGSGRECRIRDVAMLAAALFKREHLLEFGARPYREGEVMGYQADVRKAERLLGWRARVGIEEGLRRMIRSRDAAGESPEDSLPH